MARWRKRLAVLAGGLVSLTGWLNAASAQNPPPPQVLEGGPNGFSEEDNVQAVPYVFKLKGEWLLWHVGMPRLSTTLATTTTLANLTNGVGALTDPGTVTLLGPGNFDYHELNGGRVTAGFATGFLPPIELSGFWVGRPTTSLLNVTSDGSATAPVLARPFQATNLPSLDGLGQQVVLSAGFPGNLAGSISVGADISLWGFETNIFFPIGASDVAGLDLIVGYRYMDLMESVNITNTLQSVNPGVNISFNSVNPAGLPPGFVTTASDFFQTRNQFNGLNLGVRPALYVGQFTATTDVKVAIGSTHQTLNISGASSLISPNGAVQTVPGGLLAVASNSGTSSRDELTLSPEIDVNVGFNLTRNIKFFATYNIFAWTNVVRAGDQLNNRVDSRQVPTDPTFIPGFVGSQPVAPFLTRSFWGQGLSVGIEIGF
jgi:hypothetical protein